MPITNNYEGSYLTFKSVNGLVFAIDLLVAGFSTVWLDQVMILVPTMKNLLLILVQAYWQRAIASRPETSVKAYLFGGIAWYVNRSHHYAKTCKDGDSQRHIPSITTF